MKITILNGDMNSQESIFSDYIKQVADIFTVPHSCTVFPLAEMKLHYCIGCFSCWWKNPGQCAIKDDAEKIFKSVINADLLIFASPLMAGFTSSELKKITDRIIVLLHPYIELKNGECHHRKRYEKYPQIGLLLKKEEDTDEEDIKIINDIYDRLAINFHGKRLFTKFVEENKAEDIVSELYQFEF